MSSLFVAEGSPKSVKGRLNLKVMSIKQKLIQVQTSSSQVNISLFFYGQFDVIDS